jgi:aspartate/glutamate racemase
MVGGHTDQLLEFARHEKEPALRRKAVELLGAMGGAKTSAALRSLYDSEKDQGLRKKVLEALFVQGDAKDLVDIARHENDPGLKKKAIEHLSVMHSKEGADFFMEILSK